MRRPNDVRQLRDVAKIRAAQTVAAQFGAQRAQSQLREAQAAKESVEAARLESEMKWRQAWDQPLLPIDALVAWSAEIQRQNAKFDLAMTEEQSKLRSADETRSAWHISDVLSDRANAAVSRAHSRLIGDRDESMLEDALEKMAFQGVQS
jgi:hypothetical protein